MNSKADNIGARRLHTVLEKILEKISYDIEQFASQSVKVNKDFVLSHFLEESISEDTEKWIL